MRVELTDVKRALILELGRQHVAGELEVPEEALVDAIRIDGVTLSRELEELESAGLLDEREGRRAVALSAPGLRLYRALRDTDSFVETVVVAEPSPLSHAARWRQIVEACDVQISERGRLVALGEELLKHPRAFDLLRELVSPNAGDSSER